MRTFALVFLLFAVEAEAKIVIVEQKVPGYVIVQNEPPADQIEVIPEFPGPDYVWLKGHWRWKNEWVWVKGCWARKPHEEALWEPPQWKRKHHHWVFVEGFWR